MCRRRPEGGREGSATTPAASVTAAMSVCVCMCVYACVRVYMHVCVCEEGVQEGELLLQQ